MVKLREFYLLGMVRPLYTWAVGKNGGLVEGGVFKRGRV